MSSKARWDTKMKELAVPKNDIMTRMCRKFSTSQVKLIRICTETGSVEKMHKLLRKNLHINVNRFIFEDGKSMLQHAVYSNHFDLVIYLIERYKADVNFISKEDGDTAMHIACRRGLFDIACYLVNTAAADVSGENSAGETPLDISSRSDKVDASILRRFILKSISLQNEAKQAKYFATTALNDMTELESLKERSKILRSRKSESNSPNKINSHSPNKIDSNVECDISSKSQIEELRLKIEEMESAKALESHILHLQNEIEKINVQFFDVTENQLAVGRSVEDLSVQIESANAKLDELAFQKIVLERRVLDFQTQIDQSILQSGEFEKTKNVLAERYMILESERLISLSKKGMDSPHRSEFDEQVQIEKKEEETETLIYSSNNVEDSQLSEIDEQDLSSNKNVWDNPHKIDEYVLSSNKNVWDSPHLSEFHEQVQMEGLLSSNKDIMDSPRHSETDEQVQMGKNSPHLSQFDKQVQMERVGEITLC